MKWRMILCLSFFFFILGGCQSQAENLNVKAEIQELPSEKDGVSLFTEKEQYTTSADTIKVFHKNDSQSEVNSAKAIFIEKKVDGIWFEFPYARAHFEDILLSLSPGEEHYLTIEVNTLENNLTPGQYRAVHRGLAAPFEIIK